LHQQTHVGHQLGTHRNPNTPPFLDKRIPRPERVEQDRLLLFPFLRVLLSSTLRLRSAVRADVRVGLLQGCQEILEKGRPIKKVRLLLINVLSQALTRLWDTLVERSTPVAVAETSRSIPGRKPLGHGYDLFRRSAHLEIGLIEEREEPLPHLRLDFIRYHTVLKDVSVRPRTILFEA
jgi:hypothetical protein